MQKNATASESWYHSGVSPGVTENSLVNVAIADIALTGEYSLTKIEGPPDLPLEHAPRYDMLATASCWLVDALEKQGGLSAQSTKRTIACSHAIRERPHHAILRRWYFHCCACSSHARRQSTTEFH